MLTSGSLSPFRPVHGREAQGPVPLQPPQELRPLVPKGAGPARTESIGGDQVLLRQLPQLRPANLEILTRFLARQYLIPPAHLPASSFRDVLPSSLAPPQARTM